MAKVGCGMEARGAEVEEETIPGIKIPGINLRLQSHLVVISRHVSNSTAKKMGDTKRRYADDFPERWSFHLPHFSI